jgi:hypothetical protein
MENKNGLELLRVFEERAYWKGGRMEEWKDGRGRAKTGRLEEGKDGEETSQSFHPSNPLLPLLFR